MHGSTSFNFCWLTNVEHCCDLLKRCCNLLNTHSTFVEQQQHFGAKLKWRTRKYFRSTTFNNFQHVERQISTFNITWYTVNICRTAATTFVAQQMLNRVSLALEKEYRGFLMLHVLFVWLFVLFFGLSVLFCCFFHEIFNVVSEKNWHQSTVVASDIVTH